MLYGLFQKFLRFNDRFRESLWAEVDLEAATKEVREEFLYLIQYIDLKNIYFVS